MFSSCEKWYVRQLIPKLMPQKFMLSPSLLCVCFTHDYLCLSQPLLLQGDASSIREVHGLPCSSFVNGFEKLHCLSKPFLKQYSIVLAKSFGQGCRIRVLPNCYRLSLQTRRSSKSDAFDILFVIFSSPVHLYSY